jgi:hypothetical protein
MKRLVSFFLFLICASSVAQDSIGSGGSSLSREAPVVVQDEGVRQGRASRVNCVGSGVTCTTDAGTWILNVSGGGGGGSPGVSCATDEALTWNGSAYSCLSKIRASFMADAGITAQQLANNPAACSAGQFVTDIAADGTLTCATPSGGGGGGSVNTASGNVYFDGGSLDSSATISAAWANTGSLIICKATGEEASIEGLEVTVVSQASGSFVVRAEPRSGSHWGDLPFVCFGN